MSALCSNRFDENIRVLESNMKTAVYFDDVSLYPGIPFVPTEVMDDFTEHISGDCISSSYFKGTKVPYLIKRDAITG